MEPRVKDSLISMLSLMISALEKDDSVELSNVSNNTIHNASIFQDEDSISLAVVSYSLSKIAARSQAESASNWSQAKASLIKSLKDAKKFLEDGIYNDYEKIVKSLMAQISSLDNKIKLYIEEVINKARIKKGSAMYYHGISLGRVAELLNISQWELMNYIGNTTISDEAVEEIDIKDRLAFARRLFR